METEKINPVDGDPLKANAEEDELDLSSMKKKKKKKKKITFDLDGQNSHPDNKEADLATEDGSKELQEEILDDPDDLGLGKKKKKKAKPIIEDEATLDGEKQADSLPTDNGDQSWSGSDRDYTYDELLDRVFDIMRQKNPEMIAGEKKRFIMKPPQCARVGTKKTSFVNFAEICQTLHRQPKHILAFILAELGTSGSVDGNNQLIIKGRFQQKQLESVLRRYIKEYVTCHTCRSPDTILERDVRLHFLRCRVCQSSCSVATIKSGFQAVTGKRARIRAKAMS